MSKEVKISVIKFEMVNGKKTYKSFTFKLNPKEMAKFKTEATVKKKVAEYVAKSGVYKPSELQNLKYDMKEFLEEWKKMVPVVEAEELAKLDKSPNNPETRVTPHLISHLAAGEIFVFGSNAMGYHDGGVTFPDFSWHFFTLSTRKGRHYQFHKTEIVDTPYYLFLIL